MLSIESLVASGANVKLEISPSDLKMFAESIVEKNYRGSKTRTDGTDRTERGDLFEHS